MCYNPVLGRDAKYKQLIYHPCRRCEQCKKQRRDDWCFRLQQERQKSNCTYFVTLTYDEEKLPHLKDGTPCYSNKDWRLFKDAIKKDLNRHFNINLKYICVGEFGGESGRPHYHAIFFLDSHISESDLDTLVHKHWKSLICRAETPRKPQAIEGYCTKYILKGYDDYIPQKEGDLTDKFRIHTSGNLGLSWIGTPESKRYYKDHTYDKGLIKGENYARLHTIPRYYRSKLDSTPWTPQRANEMHEQQLKQQQQRALAAFSEWLSRGNNGTFSEFMTHVYVYRNERAILNKQSYQRFIGLSDDKL